MDQQSTKDQGAPMAQPPQSTAPVPPAAPPMPHPQPARPSPPAPAHAAPATDTPVQAADSDVIEAEWVHKAKQIVAATQGDPYKQVIQLNQLKADYMQKRYNKTVKLPDA